MENFMNWAQAQGALRDGKMVKLPEWVGHWFMGEDNNIKVFDRSGDVLDIPYVDDYKNRTDWYVTDGCRDFGGALCALKAGKCMAREGWNGNGIFVYLNKGSIDHTILPKCNEVGEVIYVTHTEGITLELFESGTTGTTTRLPNINLRNAHGSTITGWQANQTDMLAEDWIIVVPPAPLPASSI